MKDFKSQSSVRYLQGQTLSASGRSTPEGSRIRAGDVALVVLTICVILLGGAILSKEDPREAAAATPEVSQQDPRASGIFIEEPEVRGLGGASRALPELERVSLYYRNSQAYSRTFPSFRSRFAGIFAALTEKNEFVFYTLNPGLQDYVSTLVARARSPHVAVVAMHPSTGKVLAIAGKSQTIDNLALHAGFPAASLFKVVTAAAAIEKRSIEPDSLIRFRGGDHTLGRHNYRASKKDNRIMSVGEAMGKSCNPVFARIALEMLGPSTLREYVRLFGFNAEVPCDHPIPPSFATIPEDAYELSRTGAGFGDVYLSPMHAAMIMSAIANNGVLTRPVFIDRVISPTGVVLYKNRPSQLRQVISAKTSQTLLKMMQYTTTMGTSRKEFMHRNRPVFPDIPVAAKTGTLSGNNPKGLNTWFIATAPMNNPKIAIAVVAVNPSDGSSKASHLGKLVLEKYFED